MKVKEVPQEKCLGKVELRKAKLRRRENCWTMVVRARGPPGRVIQQFPASPERQHEQGVPLLTQAHLRHLYCGYTTKNAINLGFLVNQECMEYSTIYQV